MIGHEVWGKPDEYHRSTFLKVLGQTFELRVYEPNLQRVHVLTKEELARKEQYGSVYTPNHDYVRSEKLCLQLRESGSTVLWESKDGKKAKVEDRLNQLFIAALRRVDVARKWRRKREEEARLQREAEDRRQKEEQQQQEAERRRQHEQARVRGLLAEAENWRKSRVLRSYLRAVRRTLEEQGRDVVPGSDLGRRLTWAQGWQMTLTRSSHHPNLLPRQGHERVKGAKARQCHRPLQTVNPVVNSWRQALERLGALQAELAAKAR